MRPAFSSRTKRRGAKALAPALRLFFLRASDMCHLYDDLTRLGQRLNATVPRILATILDGTIVAGMVVLLHRRRTARFMPYLHIRYAKDIAAPVHDRQRGFATSNMRSIAPPRLAAASSVASLPATAMRATFSLRLRLRATANRTNMQIGAHPDKRRNVRAG